MGFVMVVRVSLDVLVAITSTICSLSRPYPYRIRVRLHHSVICTCSPVYIMAMFTPGYLEHQNVLATIQQKFGTDGKRVRQLIALRHEALGEYEQALRLYRQLLDQDPGNAVRSTRRSIYIYLTRSMAQFPVKRQVVIYCAQGKKTEAVKTLNRHLETFMADTEAWEQLMHLYVEDKQWEQAAYCAEELLLLRPLLFGYHLQYADVRGVAHAICSNMIVDSVPDWIQD